MKRNYLLVILLGTALLIGCSTDTVESELINETDNTNATRDPLPIGGDPIGDPGTVDDGNLGNETNVDDDLVQDLMAGQNINVGSVTASDIDSSVDVTYQTDGDWEIVEVHLFVGQANDLPLNNGGNPQIGQFPYSATFGPGTTTVNYNDLLDIPEGECVWVAAHAVVVNSVTGQEETAWASGDPIGSTGGGNGGGNGNGNGNGGGNGNGNSNGGGNGNNNGSWAMWFEVCNN